MKARCVKQGNEIPDMTNHSKVTHYALIVHLSSSMYMQYVLCANKPTHA